ncbi:response regulator transcription factor [Bacteroidota bacterium]
MFKIAIIDDDPDIVEATTLLLESKGYQVIKAGNVEDAMSLIESEQPDLILLDVMMEEPDDGFYMANKIRKIGLKTPIIMLTSVSKAIGYDYGASESLPVNDFLEKPVLPSVLMEKIVFHLEKSGGVE